MFRALILEEAGGVVTPAIRELDDSLLPAGNVTVAVEYTTINYKDGLVINGGGGLVKRWPHVPGIDFAGTVQKSEHPAYQPGDRVVLTGWRVGRFTGVAVRRRHRSTATTWCHCLKALRHVRPWESAPQGSPQCSP